MERCHCGQILHYTDPTEERDVRELVAQFGEFVRVTHDGRTWLVQRHWIALHGLDALDLPHLGFREVTHDR